MKETQLTLDVVEVDNERKQRGLLQGAYDDLVKRHEQTRNNLETAQQAVIDMEAKLQSYAEMCFTFKKRVVTIPYSIVKNMFLLEKNPTSIYLCINHKEQILWLKTETEVNEVNISE